MAWEYDYSRGDPLEDELDYSNDWMSAVRTSSPNTQLASNNMDAGWVSLGDKEAVTEEKAQAETEIANEVLAGALKGDFNDDPTFWSDVGQIITGLIPIAGQLGDAKDLIHTLDDITNQEGYKKIGSWATLVLIVIGFVPGVGDAIKSVGRRGIKYLDNNRITKRIGEWLGDNIISPILERVGDLTAPIVGQIKDAIRRKLAQAQEIARQLGEGAGNVIDDVTGRPQVATEGAGNINPSQVSTNQPSQVTTSGRSGNSSSTTTAGRVISPLVGKDFNNLTPAELAQFKRDYYTQGSGSSLVIKRNPGKAKQGVPQIHIEEVNGKQIIKDGPADASANQRLSRNHKENYEAVHGKLPDGHQVHHIIPDAIVRDNELAKMAYDEGIFDLDRVTNLQAFPEVGKAGEIIHRGPHDKWSKYVERVLEDEQKKLLQRYKVVELKDIPEATLDKELKAIFGRVEKNLRRDLNNVQLGIDEGWLKLDKNGTGSYRISENEEENTQVVVA